MKKDKVKIIRDWFISWIIEDTSIEDAMSHEGSIESYALGIAESIPLQHISNWEDVKHHWNDDDYDEYEVVASIPDTLEVRWVQSEEEA